MKPQRISRRRFFGRTLGMGAAGVAALEVIPERALASPGANERIGVGYIGLGARGRHILTHLTKDAQIVAVCDVDARKVEEVAKGQDYARYGDYRKLLDSKTVDAVVITTPDHWHALQAIHACQAGKDVFCDKPLSLTVREGRAMVEAAHRYGHICQAGPQQRSIPAAIYACNLVRSGRLGKILEVHCTNNDTSHDCDLPGEPIPDGLDWGMWLGPSAVHPFNHLLVPSRYKEFGWMAYKPWSGGNMTSWGTHGLDIMQWGLGMDRTGPAEVEPLGTGLNCPLVYRYANGVVVKLDQAPQGGAIFVGEKGKVTVACGIARYDPPELGKDAPPNLDNFLGHKGPLHTQQWLKCVRTRECPSCEFEIGHRGATVAHLGNIARWLGRKLHWNSAEEKFAGDEEANALLSRPMRPPWRLS
jgi:predicted dehydrogenase